MLKNNELIVSTYLYDYLRHKGFKSTENNAYHCLNPDHNDKHPSMFIFTGRDGKPRLKCQSCGFTMDLYNLIKLLDKINGFKAQYNHVCSIFNINTHMPVPSSSYQSKKNLYSPLCIDVNKYISECKNHPEKCKYWHQRGIIESVQNDYNLGYDGNTNALIIPISKGYIQRFLGNTTPKYKRSRGLSDLFMSNTFNNKYPIIITEGEIDALSLLSCSYPNVIALGGISKLISIYLKLISMSNFAPIIAVDNDISGQDTFDKLYAHCFNNNLTMPNTIWNYFSVFGIITDDYKDINDILLHDKTSLIRVIKFIKKKGTHYEKINR